MTSTGDIAVVSLDCPDQTFPSVGALHPPAIRLERAIHSLYGYAPVGAPDSRPWLDLGFWDVRHPLGARIAGSRRHMRPINSFPSKARACIRFPSARCTPELSNRDISASPQGARRWCGSKSGSATCTKESSRSWPARRSNRRHGSPPALRATAPSPTGSPSRMRSRRRSNIEAPPRAQYLRALMAELERLANHLGDIGAICNDASFALMHAHCGILRELVLRAADGAFGHRLMMDRVVPGGVTADLSADGTTRIRETVRHIRRRFPRLVELYDNTASLQDRTAATGILRPELARQFGASGYIGRASGRNVDARKIARLRALRSARPSPCRC